MQTYFIKIKNNAIIEDAVITVEEGSYKFVHGAVEKTEKDEYPFKAIRNIRKELEKHNIKIFINASRMDVHPSGVLAYSNSAYIHKMGQQSLTKDIVGLFDQAFNDEKIGTVEEQERYLFEWINSLKLRRDI